MHKLRYIINPPNGIGWEISEKSKYDHPWKEMDIDHHGYFWCCCRNTYSDTECAINYFQSLESNPGIREAVQVYLDLISQMHHKYSILIMCVKV